MSPLKITIGIPTIAGRSGYLAAALRTCLDQADDDLEILVSDNSPGTARDVVEGFRDPRIRYVSPPGYLPMSAHWDFMVSHFTGDLVCVIGDDDGLMPGSIARVREIAAEFGLRPIQHALANYCWPDFPDAGDRDKFWFMHSPGRAVGLHGGNEYLAELCGARARYIDGPMVYHNFVPGDLLRRLAIDGSVFHRSSPDIYSAITVAAHTSHFVRTQEVLTLAGQGARANGASVRDGGADGKRFLKEMKAPQYVARFRSRTVQLQLLDSILEAAERYQLPQLRERIDWGAHFRMAANECLDMPHRPRGMRELATVVADAARHGRLAQLVGDRGTRLLEKLAGRGRTGMAADTAPAAQALLPGVRRTLPHGVADVHAASLHIRDHLATSGIA